MNYHTVLAVQRQLWAMACERYDIGLVNLSKSGGKRTAGIVTAAEVEKMLPNLARLNAGGENILVRPALDLDRALILVDDINEAGIAALRQNGFEPCLVVETSPCNCQAWVDFGRAPMPEYARTALAREIARSVHADPASAEAKHYGRLAGYTNRKAAHAGAGGLGRFPFVKVAFAGDVICSKAEIAREWASAQIPPKREEEVAPEATVPLDAISARFERYCAEWAAHPNHARRADGSDDISTRDHAAASRLLQEGCAAGDIVAVLAAHPDTQRKDDPLAYARRTVNSAKRAINAAQTSYDLSAGN